MQGGVDMNKYDKLQDKIREITFADLTESDSKRENANIDGNTAMGTMLQYGSIISKAFCNENLLKPLHRDSHLIGDIHMHDQDFYNMGTLTCCQIDLDRLFSGGFSTGHGYLREPQSIASYAAHTAIAIQANQNDMHGGQAIPALDHYLAKGVVKSFRKHLIQSINMLLDFSGHTEVSPSDIGLEEISTIKLSGIETNNIIARLVNQGLDNVVACRIFYKANETAYNKTERETFQAMEGLVGNLNTMHSRAGAQIPFSSLNYGTDTSPEGRMVTENILKAIIDGLGNGETPIFPIGIFKVKEGVNYNPGDPNYDLFRLSLKATSRRLFPNYGFIDAPFNLKYYNPDDFRTEICYMGCRTRTIANLNGPEIPVSRGNLSFTSVNLPRLGLKFGRALNDGVDYDGFFNALDNVTDIAIDQLLERFKYQAKRKVKNFPFLMGEGIWIDSDKLNSEDTIEEVARQGSLTVGFIGLAECLIALIGEHHGESEDAQQLGLKIIEFMNEKLENASEIHGLNFALLATPAEGLSGRFVAIDREVYGEVKGVTDKEFYTNSFHIPVYYDISVADKISIEAPYHALTPGGHITYVELDGAAKYNIDALEAIVRHMKESGIGYGSINHPVDRCPSCGHTNVIGNECPNCSITEDDIDFERIRRITGYLVGTIDRWNDAKRSEESMRVKHNMNV